MNQKSNKDVCKIRRKQVVCRAEAGTLPSAAAAEIPSGTSFAQAVFSVLNVIMGVGLLSLPLALTKSGYAGILVLATLGAVNCYTAKALCSCAATVAAQRAAGSGAALPGAMVRYEDVATAAFGRLGRRAVAAIMYPELLGTCALLVILESDNLWNLFGARLAEAAPGMLTALLSTPEGVFWFCAGVLVPTAWARSVKSLAFLSLCGFAATVTVAASVAFTLLTGQFPSGAATVAVRWDTLPFIFGIMAFCYSGHSVFPSVQASMARPQDFPRVLDTAYATVAGLSCFIAAAGYYMFGAGALDVITFNFPPGRLKLLCACLILVNPVAKFALTLEPVALAARAAVARKMAWDPGSYPLRLVVNTAIAALVVMIARFVPFLSILMSLVGAFMTIFISILFPAVANLKLNAKSMSRTEKVWACLVICIGIACAISGTTAALFSLQMMLQTT